jgi:pyruvate,orthophosphate dikinase
LLQGAAGLLAVNGGITSHGAVLMRTLNIPALTAVCNMSLDAEQQELRNNDGLGSLRAGDWVTIDGSSGLVYRGEVKTVPAGQDQYFSTLLFWADKYKQMAVRASVSCKADVTRAVEFRADGIGLLRTEYMFSTEECLPLFQQVILSEDAELRQKCLAEIMIRQRADFVDVFKVVKSGLVKIRLLDSPLSCFLPDPRCATTFDEEVRALAVRLHMPQEECLLKIRQLQEENPAYGLRGSRLFAVYPEIVAMQVTAIAGAVFDAKRTGIPLNPSIVIPRLFSDHEAEYLLPLIQETLTALCDSVVQSMRFLNISLKFLNISLGVAADSPRACTRMEKIATTQGCDFVAFDTDELTACMFGVTKDQASTLVPTYLEANLLAKNPFEELDVGTVGTMLHTAVDTCQRVCEHAEIDVNGNHCSNANSVRFLSHIGFSSVSCDPDRVPIAKLAAAQAKIHYDAMMSSGMKQDAFWSQLAALPTVVPK